jgi:D-aminoacyl-tRNA deacylase
MRAIIQRVSSAAITINDKVHSKINYGMLVLVGIENNDTPEDASYITNKIVSMRIFNDANHLMNLSIKDIQGEILLVSQFTLHAQTKKGNRPSFIRAANAAISEPIYKSLVTHFEKVLEKPLQTGVFGADMKVSLINDGPVTIIIDSKSKDF